MNNGISDPQFPWSCGFAVGCGGARRIGRRWGCMDKDEVMGSEVDGAADLLAASRQGDVLDLEWGMC